MSFKSLELLLKACEEENLSFADVVLKEESEESGLSPGEIRAKLKGMLQVMEKAAKDGISPESRSLTGLTGGDGAKMIAYLKNEKPLGGAIGARACAYAVACAQVNASMGVIVAAPTAGSCGILPGVLLSMREELSLEEDAVIDALLVASGIGAVIATRATLSGAEGGCQAECGSAGAMAAAAACALSGRGAETCVNAAALALKNSLGLACDPVCGLVEVPCVKRNGIYASLALAAADMSMAGIKSAIPADEVIDAMYMIGRAMPAAIRETGTGGLAATPTGISLREKLLSKK